MPSDIAGVAGYDYRLDGGEWTWTIEPAGKIAAGEGPHTFEVRAVDNLGNVGAASSIDIVVDVTAPEAPTGLRLDGAVLHWEAPADTNGIWRYQYRLSLIHI